jgi:NADH-quinone oxidoreductase subunit M
MDFLRILLVLLLLVPFAGAIAVALCGTGRAALVRQLSLTVTVLDLLLALIVAAGFLTARGEQPLPRHSTTFRPEVVPGAASDKPNETTWNLIEFAPALGERQGSRIILRPIQFYLGLDGLNVWLIVLSSLLMVTAVLISWTSINERVHEYYAWLLMLGGAMLGVFLSFDVILFYVFFELTLVPLFFLIGIWGGPERRYAARKFFIYTITGSLITLLGILAVISTCYQTEDAQGQHVLTFSIPELVSNLNAHLSRLTPLNYGSWYHFQVLVFLALAAGFSVKVPLFPFHTWLPLAHTEAPTAGSVLLAGVLLKLGTYGYLRLALPLAPDAAIDVGVPLVGVLAVIGILYGAFCSRAQDDIKKLVAYSSVSHLGFAMLGMFALNSAGLSGSVMQMLNHGLSTGALFLIVGMLYERYHTRLASDYSGIAAKLGLLSAAMVFVCLSSVGLPGLNGFIGEALVFFGMFERDPLLAIIGTGGILLGAWYLFTMLRAVFFGPLHEPHEGDSHAPVADLSAREVITLAPILALCLYIGLHPQPLLSSMQPDVNVVAHILGQRDYLRTGSLPPPPADEKMIGKRTEPREDKSR